MVKIKNRFYKARSYLLEELRNSHSLEDMVILKQRLALCYYKDNEINYKISFKKALEILQECEELLKNNNIENFEKLMSENLSLKGAVYKRYFEKEKRISDLKKAIEFYEEAFNSYKEIDNGYAGINAANLYELLGYELNKIGIENSFLQKANEIRKELKDLIKLNHYWDYFSLANVHLGLKDTKKCNEVLKEVSKKFEIADWEKYTTFKDLKLLAKIKNIENLSFLTPLFKNVDVSLKKTGLALSGGGFRASFFHLGTLAVLAEANRLKDIEVISTVSGGSVVGVLYYLKLKQLFDNKDDSEITQEDYLQLISELIDEFFEAVQKDIRNRLFYNPLAFGLEDIDKEFINNILKFFKFYFPFNSYTRTKRVAELYDKFFYKKYGVKYLRELKIIPKNLADFSPRYENFKRINKIPILVINATNLNNGHNFQFQATKIGENELIGEYDRNFLVEWLRFDECEKVKDFKLSEAVAASTAVPGIFPALKLKLSKEIELNLADGGVYDNQGINGLLMEECDEMIISDGGYEMDDMKKIEFFYNFPKTIGIVKYIKRSTDVLMDVNRDLFYEKANSLANTSSIVLNSKNEIDKISCHSTKFKIPKIYEEISKIRTDLNKFTKDEAGKLMAFGYSLAKEKLEIRKENSFWFKKYLEVLK